MATKFVDIKYKWDTSKPSDNFDEYMKALKVDLIHRKLGNTVGHVIVLLKDGDEYTLKTTSIAKNFHITFKLGVEGDQVTADGRKVKYTMTEDGNKLIEVQKLGDGRTTTIVREFTKDSVLVTMTVDDIVSTRHYILA